MDLDECECLDALVSWAVAPMPGICDRLLVLPPFAAMRKAHDPLPPVKAHNPSPPTLQVKRAQECEANTGPAQRPDLTGAAAGGASAAAGAAAGAAAAEEEELDPLDAFMAEIGQIEKAEGSGKPRIERMEAEDNVEAFVQVRGCCTCSVKCGGCCWLWLKACRLCCCHTVALWSERVFPGRLGCLVAG